MHALKEVDFEAAINDCLEDMADCWNQGDSVGFCKYYTESAVLAVRGPKYLIGKQKILEYHQTHHGIPGAIQLRLLPQSLKFAPTKRGQITKATIMVQSEIGQGIGRISSVSLMSFILTDEGLRIDHELES